MSNWQLIATLATLVFGTFAATWLNTQLMKHYIDARFDTVMAKLETINIRIGVLEIRLDKIERQLDKPPLYSR